MPNPNTRRLRVVLIIVAISITGLLRANDDAFTALLSSANQQLRDGKLAEARQTSNTAAHLAPERFEGHFLAGLIARQQGALSDSYSLLNRAMQLAPEEKRRVVQALLDDVRESLAQGHPVTPPRTDLLSLADRRELDTLLLIPKEAESATSVEGRHVLLREFLEKSVAFLKRYPDHGGLWIARAAAALEVEAEVSAKRAGQKLQELGLEDTNEGARKICALLNRRGWLVGPTPRSSEQWPESGATYENSLGMRFVPVPGISGLVAIWVTRIRDFQTFTSKSGTSWSYFTEFWDAEKTSPDNPDFPATPVHWEDAKKFCDWLTMHERAAGRIGLNHRYRLPTDAEWSIAVGLVSEYGGNPRSRDENGDKQHFAWGNQWPPPSGVGNLADEQAKGKHPKWKTLSRYDDGYADLSPVGKFRPNQFGLYDMAGNVQQWCEDAYDPYAENEFERDAFRTLRGSNYSAIPTRDLLRASFRQGAGKVYFRGVVGFRCVLEMLPDEP